MSQLSFLKKIIGNNLTKKIRPLGHGIKGILAALKYGNPARKVKLIGITGTKGKTTTTMYTGRMLNMSGIKTGYISTGSIYLGNETNSGELDNLQSQLRALQKLELELKNIDNQAGTKI